MVYIPSRSSLRAPSHVHGHLARRARCFRSRIEAVWQAWLPVVVVFGMIALLFKV